MQPMSDVGPSPRRSLLGGIGGATRLVALVVGVVVLAILGLRSPTADQGSTPSSPPAAVVGAATAAGATSSTQAAETMEASAAASLEPTTEPTFAPTAEPPTPTPKPTAKPTSRPTPKPTHDPTPEGTPKITTKSGSFGQTLTVQGITTRVAKTATKQGALNCVTDDPERQGWTELVSYDLTMSWPDAGDAEEPWVAVGAKPWNVLQFDGPSPFKSGADYIVSTCHRPGDSDKVMVEISPPGSPLIYYRWYFH
jgi:hypothetical protein